MGLSRLLVYSVLMSAVFLSFTTAHNAAAQDAPEKPRPPIFGQLFPNPTGMNGYEEWLQASDLIQNNAQIDKMSQPDATLTNKRRLLADPHVQTALHLLHTGMSKPIQPPRMSAEDDALRSHYAAFRKLGSLLAVEMYVQLADGRVDAALDTLDDGLRFAFGMHSDRWISGLSGIVTAEQSLQSIGAHLDQLSEYQCLRVRRIVEENMQRPSPVPSLLLAQRLDTMQRLDRMGADSKGVASVLGSFSSDESEWGADERRLAAQLRADPAHLPVLVAQAKTQWIAYCDAVVASRKLPAGQRKPLPAPKGETPGGTILGIFGYPFEFIFRHYDSADAMLRLLGVHAAIHAYKWEYNHLPATLNDLHLGGLALDPFTGEPLRYQNNGATYDLFSSGPVSRGDDGKPDNGPPTPVRL